MDIYGSDENKTYELNFYPTYSYSYAGKWGTYNSETQTTDYYYFNKTTDGRQDFFGGAGNETIIVNLPGSKFDELVFNKHAIKAGAGDDTLIVELPSVGNGVSYTSVDYDAGDGYDSITLDFSKGQKVTMSSFDGTKLWVLGESFDKNNLTQIQMNIDDTVEHFDVEGSQGKDSLQGLSGNDWLDGNRGADVYWGSAGDDAYVFDNAGDRIFTERAGGGTDSLYSSVSVDLTWTPYVENIRLYAGENLSATGNEEQNIITGNAQDNIITGGKGYDKLYGRGGADTFLYGEMGAGNRDLIVDFDSLDKIQLKWAFTGLDQDWDRNVDVDAFTIGGGATLARAQIIYNDTTGMIAYDKDGTGAEAALDIVRIGKGVNFLDSGDFIFA